MIVCHCMVVSNKHLEAAVDEGARHVDEVVSICGASTGCGGCREAVERVVERAIDRLKVCA